MATINELVIKITSDVKGATDGLKKVTDSTNTMASKQKSTMASVREHWKAYAVAIGVAVAAIGTMVKWSAEEQAVSVKTAALLRQQSIEYEKIAVSLDKYFKQIEKVTSFNDTEVQEAFNQLIVTGVDYTTALENMTTVTDVAFSTNMDLRTSAMLVGRAITGDVNMLARYIPAIKKLTAEQRTWDNIQKILNDTMADSSQRSQSLQGAIDNLNNQMHNVVEAGGAEMLKLITELSQGMSNLAEGDASAKFAASVRIGLAMATIFFNTASLAVKTLIGDFKVLTGQMTIEEVGATLAEDLNDIREAAIRDAEAWDVLINGVDKSTDANQGNAISIEGVTTALNKQNEAMKTAQSLQDQFREFHAADEGARENIRAATAGELLTPIATQIPAAASNITPTTSTGNGAQINTLRAELTKQTGDIAAIAAQPRSVNVNVVIEKVVSDEDEFQISAKIAQAMAQGIDTNNIKQR